ncbi:MAG: ACP S-malonyltransferase [Candidatus Zixiibacteriota bacterium]|nr:MAG: ACP S-malonyltransferase [candidate division Zixibacteria bacterium]
MDRVAIVFPGQASQYVGMGKDLYDAGKEVRELYALASKEIGEDIGCLSFDGPAETLKQTRFTQPAILLHSLAALSVLKENVPEVALTAGHSLGEYGSLALAGVLSFEDAIRAVVKRSSLMEQACRENPGTMAAIVGLEDGKIAEACKTASAKGVVVPANFNSANQVVISGTTEAIEEACRLCSEMGAKRAMILQVGGAFHSPLMEPAREGMREYLNSVEFEKPTIGIVPNVTAETEYDPLRLKGLLIDQLTSPVRWYQTMKCFAEAGVDTVIEVGPGKVLTGLAKRELRGARIFNLDTLEDVEKFYAVIAG